MIEKRRRDRINRCLNELGKTVPMALAKQVTSAVLLPHCHSLRSPKVSADAAGLRELAPLRELERSSLSGSSIFLAGPLQKTESILLGLLWVGRR